MSARTDFAVYGVNSKVLGTRARHVFTDHHFSGPGRAVSPLCVCVSVRTVTFELRLIFYLDIWHDGSP